MANASGSHSPKNTTDYPRSAGDLYLTPAEAVERLYAAQPKLRYQVAWDASAGLGHIVRAIRDLGCEAVGTELTDHPYERVAPVETGVDLFELAEPRAPVAIINPPFGDAARHVDHLLDLGCTVYALLRLNFVAAKRHAALMKWCSHVLILGRVKILPPDAQDKGFSPTIDFAWLRFGQSLAQLKELRRI